MAQQQLSLEKLRTARRCAVDVGDAGPVRMRPWRPDTSLPLLIEPVLSGLDPVAWATHHREFIESSLLKHGGILFRHFDITTADQFRRFMETIAGELLSYNERSSPRTQVSDHVYTSTDYPADHSIFLHNENSYQRTWPMKIFFFCETRAEIGGETPIADCRRVYARLSASLREQFIVRNWMYVRNFGDGFGLPWQTVFQTSDRRVVEEHCEENGIEVTWKDGDRLRLRAVRQAVYKHPRTGENVWFNHATFFHVTTMEPAVRDMLLAEVIEDDLPTNSFYGDGTPIEPDVLAELRESYRAETVVFPWQRGDVLLLDNMLAAHGRMPYTGTRKILVGMAQPFES
jgi:alpha-ketoglutarate-dependent taurine dioxygenase